MNDIVRRPGAKPQVLPQPQPSVPPPQPEGLSLPPKKRRIWPWVLGGFGALLLLACGAVAAGYLWYTNALKPVSGDTQPITVVIENGETTERIAQKLESVGLVQSALATQLYIRLNNINVKAGQYAFEPNQSVPEIADWLASGRVDTFKVTIVPGQTLADIRSKLLTYGYDSAEIDAAFAKTYDHALFAGGQPADLEGYIYPETYFVTVGSSAEDLFTRTFDQFETMLAENNIRAQLQAKGYSLHQGVTLASVVSKEVPDYEDRRKVAQVFEKRLQLNMPLGADATFVYAARLLGVPASPSLDSPYNTRKYTGLPPGPISNMTIEPLLAVVQPANTSYLYFVSGDDGITRFSFTVEEHEANVQKYCRKLCGLE